MKDIKFINDKVVKKILNSEKEECREYLVRIISAVTSIDINVLRDNIELITPEISSNTNTVNSTVDSIYKDNNNYFNIEVNYNNNPIALVKNNIYVYNMILRQVSNSEEYNKVMPVIQININNYDNFKEGEFVYKSQMMDIRSRKVRDELITIYDINLEYLREIDYNEVKKGNSYNLEKLLYIFICENNRILDYVYNGDEIMLEIKDEFKSQIKELDDMLYYDPEDLKRQMKEWEYKEAVKEGKEQGKLETKQEIVKNMIDNNLSDDLIMKSLNITFEELQKFK